MDFARKQLEKYGWTDGTGLGKHGTGISEPIKPKLKRSTTGVGYDLAADLTENWWCTLYNKAASNVEVENKNGKTKKIRRKSDEEFVITNSTWKLNKKIKDTNSEEEYSEFFVKTAVMTSGGDKILKVKHSDSESEDNNDTNNIKKVTDEELFAACQGRTAHKGARHGLRALGKLARIEQQEKILLQQEKYNGYSHSMKIKDVSHTHLKEAAEDMNIKSDDEANTLHKKKKKKQAHVNVLEKSIDSINEESNTDQFEGINTKYVSITEVSENENVKKFKKKKKCIPGSETTFTNEDSLCISNLSKKKRRKI